jgi:hypothetical protein
MRIQCALFDSHNGMKKTQQDNGWERTRHRKLRTNAQQAATTACYILHVHGNLDKDSMEMEGRETSSALPSTGFPCNFRRLQSLCPSYVTQAVYRWYLPLTHKLSADLTGSGSDRHLSYTRLWCGSHSNGHNCFLSHSTNSVVFPFKGMCRYTIKQNRLWNQLSEAVLWKWPSSFFPLQGHGLNSGFNVSKWINVCTLFLKYTVSEYVSFTWTAKYQSQCILLNSSPLVPKV